MSDYSSYNRIDFIIMIVLALLVAFIIGFNIVQIVDSKLSSVTINVPPQNCNLPPIYLNLDKNNEIKQIKLNDVLSTISNETNNYGNYPIEKFNNTENFENFENIQNNVKNNNIEINNDIEEFGNIRDYPDKYDSNTLHLMTGVINPNISSDIIESKDYYQITTDPNYNTVNSLPLLVAPDPPVPNNAGSDAKGYYASKVKLIEDPNSPLMKLAKSNANKINETVAKCTLANSKRIPEINGTFDGYNAFVDLKTDSYANITSIGKSMLSPYVSYPVPS